MRICVDTLFGQYFPETVLKYTPVAYGVGLFAGYFRREDGGFDEYKTAIPLARKLAEKGHPLVRGQLLWDDGHRYGLPGDEKRIVDEAKKWEQVAKANPNCEVQISPFCEYGPLPKPIDYYCDLVSKVAPHCLVIASPSRPYNGIPSKKYRSESHGSDPLIKNGQYSLDGSSAYDVNLPELLGKMQTAGCINFFLWIPQFNRKGKVGDKTPRPNRKIIPTKEQFELMYFQLTKRGKANLDGAYIYKSSADQAPNPAYPVSEDCKPVLVAPANAKFKQAELLLANGKVITTMPWTDEQREEINGKPIGPVVGQLYRMAANEWGHKLAERVAKLQKQKVLRVRLGGKIIGTVNPGMRQNKWRWD